MRSNTPERAAAEQAEREAALRASGASGAEVKEQIAPLSVPSDEPLDLSHLMAHPAVKAAIASAAAAAAAAAVEQTLLRLQIERGAEAPVAPVGALTDRAFVESLALSINELVDQGRPNQKRTVAPAILAMRANARNAMTVAILKTRARGIVPEYALTGNVYLSETWIKATWVASDHVERQRRIKWPGVPNQAMRPMDDAAVEIYRLFCESIGASPAPLAKDPLTAGFKILGQDGNPPELGQGQGALGDDAVQIGGRAPQDAIVRPIHILGTVADPARPVTYNG